MKDIKLKLECDCGCLSELVITKFDEDNEVYTIGNKISGYNSAQEGFWWIIKHRLKFIWFILSGKEYFLYDIIVQKRDLVQFLKDALVEIESTVE